MLNFCLFSVQPAIIRPETPNSDTSSTKLPSLAMERIKIRTNNARDRMEIMQKRYHEYKESLELLNDTNNTRRASLNASPFEVSSYYNVVFLQYFCY